VAETVPDVDVAPRYRLLDSADAILEELSRLYYEARHTKRMASGRASRLAYLLSKASELVNQKVQQRELAAIREQLERLQGQPALPHYDAPRLTSRSADAAPLQAEAAEIASDLAGEAASYGDVRRKAEVPEAEPARGSDLAPGNEAGL